MANRLKMAEHYSIVALARLGWSYRRIAAEVGVDRETVSRHVRAARGDPPCSNATISITGSAVSADDGRGTSDPAAIDAADPNATISITGSVGRRSRCEPWRAVILAKLEQGLSTRRIWQDLTAEHGFTDSYQSVQRFVRTLGSTTPLPFRRMECAPGEEAQVDFGRGAPILTTDGNLLKHQAPPQEQFEFTQEHPLIRSLSDYGQALRRVPVRDRHAPLPGPLDVDDLEPATGGLGLSWFTLNWNFALVN